MTKHLYDTHFHLDLHKDKHGVIENITKNEIYTIAMTNLPDLYQKEVSLYGQKYIKTDRRLHYSHLPLPDGMQDVQYLEKSDGQT